MTTSATLVAGALLFVSGCATIPLYRYRFIEAERGEAHATAAKSSLASAEAIDLFRRVARKLEFKVEGPVQISATETAYTADAEGSKQANRCSLMIRISNRRILFIASIYGTKEDLRRAGDVIAQFRQALDNLSVKYRVREGVAIPPP